MNGEKQLLIYKKTDQTGGGRTERDFSRRFFVQFHAHFYNMPVFLKICALPAGASDMIKGGFYAFRKIIES